MESGEVRFRDRPGRHFIEQRLREGRTRDEGVEERGPLLLGEFPVGFGKAHADGGVLRQRKTTRRDDAETTKGEAIKLAKDAKIRRVVLCSGKVYYDLYEDREKRGIDDVYLLRVEQLYPFPLKSLANELARFKGADIVWCQEEPKNMGSWSFVEPYLEWVLGHSGAKAKRVRYVGRPASAATATGLMSKHLAQLKAFMDEAFAA
jgi:2-oxoglutarate dehydrogenase complex dehydrogenase (E1) component-like enzyme